MTSKAAYKNIRVLIIDDDRAIRTMLAESLGAMGYIPEQAPSAEVAIGMFESQAYNIAVTDIKMGKMNGIELAQKLREAYPAVGIIIVTGFSTSETRQAAQRLTAVQYIEKPIQMDIFSEALASACRWNIAQIIARVAERYLQLSGLGVSAAKMQKVKAELKNTITADADISALMEFDSAKNPQATPLYARLGKNP